MQLLWGFGLQGYIYVTTLVILLYAHLLDRHIIYKIGDYNC